MDNAIFTVLSFIGGLCLFLFGMNLMGDYLEKSAGSGLKTLLGRLTTGKVAGFFTGLAVTAVIQSSSATTVMVVGFVNSGIMTLKQAINVILGANVGTTVTAWILSLTGIEGDSIFIKLLKPTSFTPILALIGVVLYVFSKNGKKKDIGVVLLGFAVLMFGMDAMSESVSVLKGNEKFISILTMFDNPFLGVIVGAVFTAVIQSSSASVGILQSLASTGAMNIGMSIPIIMGQNIGTCVTALLSSIGTTRNARRASLVHLFFNIIGTLVLLSVFCVVKYAVSPVILSQNASEFSIAVSHTLFNVVCTALMLPAAGLLEKISMTLIPEPHEASKEKTELLDARLMTTPAIAIERSRTVTEEMANISAEALYMSMDSITEYTDELAHDIRKKEKSADKYEDILGSYLVNLNTHPLNAKDSNESAMLLHIIGDFERISDHAVGILVAVEELRSKNISLSDSALHELSVMRSAVKEIMEKTVSVFVNEDLELALEIEPLEEIIDDLKESLRSNHIVRMQKGGCSIEAGFVWSDLLNNLERVSDHCSNIAGCIIEMKHQSMDVHNYLKKFRADGGKFSELYESYGNKYSLK